MQSPSSPGESPAERGLAIRHKQLQPLPREARPRKGLRSTAARPGGHFVSRTTATSRGRLSTNGLGGDASGEPISAPGQRKTLPPRPRLTLRARSPLRKESLSGCRSSRRAPKKRRDVEAHRRDDSTHPPSSRAWVSFGREALEKVQVRPRPNESARLRVGRVHVRRLVPHPVRDLRETDSDPISMPSLRRNPRPNDRSRGHRRDAPLGIDCP